MLGVTRKLQMLGIAALTAVVLAACGAGTTPASTQPSAAATSAVPAASAATTGATAALSAAPATAAPSAAPDATAATGATAAPSAAPDATAAIVAAKLNLNTVTEDQLMSTIPGFSARMVREFMEYRPYISIQQFRKEIGKYVDAEQVTAYEQYIYVPVDVDQADAATLQQLPGVDAAIADQLIAGRPYGSGQAFLTKLTGLVSAADAQQAAAYLAAA
jgi:DNA uptake protein ComE-like DNA-binding protein